MPGFSAISVLGLYLLERVQGHLFLSNGMPGVIPDTAWNTAVSFTTNTNWQNYSGETTMGYLTQMSGLAVQNFASAAVGIAVPIAMVRGFTLSRPDRLGNFWVDLTRIIIRVLLPLSVIGGIILIAGGTIDNFTATHVIHPLTGGTQNMTGGPAPTQAGLKENGKTASACFNAPTAPHLRHTRPS